MLDNLQTLLMSRDAADTEARKKLEMDVRAMRDENAAVRARVDEARADTQRERADRDAREKEFALLLEAKEKQLLDVREQLSRTQVSLVCLCVCVCMCMLVCIGMRVRRNSRCCWKRKRSSFWMCASSSAARM